MTITCPCINSAIFTCIMSDTLCVCQWGSRLIRRLIKQPKSQTVLYTTPQDTSSLYVKISFDAYFKGGHEWT